MRVLVTGGTGFVGSHTVRSLRRDGHDVRLFVRSPGKVAPTMENLGVDPAPIEVAQGDLADRASVEAALDGVDAVVHAASIYSLDPADAAAMNEANLAGAKAVVGTAATMGLDPIVHVSSVVALLDDRRVQHLSAESAVGTSRYPYSGSKAAQEAYVRSLQDDGASVVITYPGGVWGPDDPYDGESTQLMRTVLRGQATFRPRGAIAIADVRDVADVHAAVMAPGNGARRLMCGGHRTDFKDMVAEVARAAGVRRPTVPVPDQLMLLLGRLADRVGPRLGRELPLSAEAAWLSAKVMIPDNSATVEATGVTFRPARETIEDQYRWMVADGRL